jgi:hypothetical protein
MFARSGTDWVGQLLLDDATLNLPEIDLSLPLAELYRGIDIDETDRGPAYTSRP